MGEVEKSSKNVPNTYYTMSHKRWVETTRNALCGKIPRSELYNTPSLGQSTQCNEAIASTERKTNCEGVKLKNVTKKCDTYYTMYHKRRVKNTRNALCGKIPGSELYDTPSLGKKHNIHWNYWEYRPAWELPMQ